MASFWRRVLAQFNPFDNGATYKNPTPQPVQRAPQPQQRPQPRVNAQQLRSSMQRQGNYKDPRLQQLSNALNQGRINNQQFAAAIESLTSTKPEQWTSKNKVVDDFLQGAGGSIIKYASPQSIVGSGLEYGGKLVNNKRVTNAGKKLTEPIRQFNTVTQQQAKNQAVYQGGNILGTLLSAALNPGGKLGTAANAVRFGLPAAADTSSYIEQAGGNRRQQLLGGAISGGVQGGLGAFSSAQALGGANLGKTALRRAAIAGVANAGENTAQQAIENKLAQQYYNPNTKITDNLVTAALMGGVLGGATRFGGEGFAKFKGVDNPNIAPANTLSKPKQRVSDASKAELQSTYRRMQTQYDNANSISTKKQISKAMQLVQKELNQRSLKTNQGGYVQIPGGKKTTLNDSELMVLNYLNQKPEVTGSATMGAGNALPQSNPSVLARAKANMKMMLKDQGGGYDGGRNAIDRIKAQDPLESLKQEATYYHGTTKDFSPTDIQTKNGVVWLNSDKNMALNGRHIADRTKAKALEYSLDKKSKLLDINKPIPKEVVNEYISVINKNGKIPKNVVERIKKDFGKPENLDMLVGQGIGDQMGSVLRKYGYDGIIRNDSGGGRSVGLINKDKIVPKTDPKALARAIAKMRSKITPLKDNEGGFIRNPFANESSFSRKRMGRKSVSENQLNPNESSLKTNRSLQQQQMQQGPTEPIAKSQKPNSLESSSRDNIQQIEQAFNGGKVKQGRLKIRLQNSERYSPELKSMIDGTYVAQSNKKTIADAKNLIRADVNAAEARARNPQNAVDMQINAELFNHYVETGQSAKANDLMQNMNETNLGQMIQILSQYDKSTPSGVVRFAQNTIKNYNKKVPENKKIKVTDEQFKSLIKRAEEIQKMPEGKERNIAARKLEDSVNELIPSTFADKAMTVWKAGLLTSPRTTMRNLLGNTIHGVTETIKDVPASVVDAALSKRTGQRTLTATTRGVISGAKEGFGVAKDIMKHGYDPTDAVEKFDIKKVNWGKNPAEQGIKNYTDFIFNWMGAQDKPFYHAAFGRSLYDQAGAAAINAGKRNDKSFIESLVKNPTTDMLKTATQDASLATFKDRNVLGKLASTAKKELSKSQGGEIVGELVAPFTGVPTSIAGQILQYSPVGLVKGSVKAGGVLAKNVPELQRKASQEIGRGVVGTGLMGIAALLTKQGLMTGQPKDQEEQKQWELEGKQPNSILIGGKWRSINSIGPEALVALAGSKLKSAENTAQAVGNIGKDFLSQTFLQGVQQPLNAITDPKRYGQSYIKSTVGSVIPNVVKDTAKAFDNTSRETNSVTDTIKASIPGLRNQLLPRRDVLGNAVPQEPTGVNAFIDLFNSKTPISNRVVDELGRLYKADQPATPSEVQGKTSVGGVKVEFTPEQTNELKKRVGERTQKGYDTFIKDTKYTGLADETRKKVLEDYRSDIAIVNKNVLAAENNIGPYDPNATQEPKKLTARQQKVLEGKETIDDYLPKESKKSLKVRSSRYRRVRSGRRRSGRGRKARVAKISKASLPRISTNIKVSAAPDVKMKRTTAKPKYTVLKNPSTKKIKLNIS